MKPTSLLLFFSIALHASSGAVAWAQDAATDDDLAADLKRSTKELRVKNKLVGLAVKVMRSGQVVAAACDGERSQGSGVFLTVDDRWHIGSITKSFTATAIARLVERGDVGWESTIGQLVDWPDVHESWRAVTLSQLLTHTSGAPANFPTVTQFYRPSEGKPRMEARQKAVRAILMRPPDGEPGKTHRYSNVGYTIAASLIEAKTGRSWEDLIRAEVFKPLKLTKAGFGPPQDDRQKLDQPRGHQNIGPFKRAVGVDADNTPIIGPAGILHMTLDNLVTYGNEHLIGESGQSQLLSEASFKFLHKPRLRRYACGWVAPSKNAWTEKRVLWHNGSNTMWYSLLVLIPESNLVIAVCSNDGDIRGAESAAFEIVKRVAEKSGLPPSD